MKDRQIKISITDLGQKTHNFTSLLALKSFCIGERDYWLERKNEADNAKQLDVHISFHSSSSYFKKIVEWISTNNEAIEADDDEEWLNVKLVEYCRTGFRDLSNRWLWSSHTFTKRFCECNIKFGQQAAEVFLNYIVKNQVGSTNRVEDYNATLLAYEFTFQNSDLVKRRKTERVSLSKLRDDFSDSKDQLYSEVEILKKEFVDWDKENKNAVLDSFEMLENDRASQKTELMKQVQSQSDDFDGKVTSWSDRVSELERLYEEKLKLSKPAQYWAQSAKKFKYQAVVFSVMILVVVSIGIISISDLFKLWLIGSPTAINLASIQGAVIFTSLAAVYAYCLRILSRLTFSSFHLMRDAEEREQLTYLYLSLTNESVIDEKSREIVLQALFSRTETGLLNNEHGPTMPGTDFLQAALKGRT
jgi:hypothetical protein